MVEKNSTSKKGKVILLLIPSNKYSPLICKYLKKMKVSSAGYITVNKGYDVVQDLLKRSRIDTKHFFFIDCVTKTITQPQKASNCFFVSSPLALTEISLAVKNLTRNKPQALVIDSLSNLLVYHLPKNLASFVYDLIDKVRQNTNTFLVMSMAKEDKGSEFFKMIGLKVDKVLELK
jgi:hypothetical protein